MNWRPIESGSQTQNDVEHIFDMYFVHSFVFPQKVESVRLNLCAWTERDNKDKKKTNRILWFKKMGRKTL